MIAAADLRGPQSTTPSTQPASTASVASPQATQDRAPTTPPIAREDSLPILDDTADGKADVVTTLAESVARRAQLMLLTQQSTQQAMQLRLDRMRADFNAAQEQRSEQLREMNALRDMAVEQGKKDDEILKKFISMI